ncbi:MAG: hypothetical protein AB1894_22570 [Chloroflexota bacterium]
MKKRIPQSFGLILLIAIFLLPTNDAWANAMPKPTEIWLRFVFRDDSIPNVEGIQLLGCSDRECSSPVLLKGFGNCNAPGCLTIPALLSDEWSLECAGNRCLFVYDDPESDNLPLFMQVIAQVAGQTSKSISVSFPLCYSCTEKWKLIIENGNLAIEQDTDSRFPYNAYKNFFLSFLISTVIELFVTVMMLWLWRIKTKTVIIKVLGVVFLANILSYPVAWLVIPSWGQFQYDYMQGLGRIVSVIVSLFTVIAIGISVKKPQTRKNIIYLTLSILVIGVCGFCGAILSGYANYRVNVTGLPTSVIILLAEIFAVTFESIFVAILMRKEITFKQAILLGALINATSFIVGLVVIR